MNFKKIIRVLLGKATPFQIILSCLLASMLAFVPHFSTAPFLFILIAFLILIFSVNIGLVIIVWAIVKALSFLLVHASFSVGVMLLHSFLQPIFQWLINAPLFAFAGFDIYLVTGGQLLGIIIGLILGFILAHSIKTLRAKGASIQSDKPAYDKWANKLPVKILSWVALGQSIHKIDWATLSAKKTKNPFRITGIILVILIIAAAFMAQSVLQSKMVKHILVQQLEKVNGATVNLASTDIDATAGKITLHGLQLANPNDLNKNLFSADTLTAQISLSNLLRARLVLNDLLVNKAESGDTRKTPGKLYVAPSALPATKPETQKDKTTETLPQLSQYMKDAKSWQTKLDQIQRLLSFVSGSTDKKEDTKSPAKNTPQTEATLYGYDKVSAAFLIEKHPTLTISKLTVKTLNVAALPNDPLNIQATNLSTEPSFLNKTPTLNAHSQSGNIGLVLKANQLEHTNQPNELDFHLNKLPTEDIMKNINSKTVDISGGYFNIKTDGLWKQGAPLQVNLPLYVTLINSDIKVANTSTHIDSLPINLTLSGSLNNPSVKIDAGDFLQNAIKSGVQQQLKNKVENGLKNQLKGLF